jgi:hypothetical protein
MRRRMTENDEEENDGERTENRRFMSLCQEKDIFGTKPKILFLCQNSICLYVFLLLGMLHFQKPSSATIGFFIYLG